MCVSDFACVFLRFHSVCALCGFGARSGFVAYSCPSLGPVHQASDGLSRAPPVAALEVMGKNAAHREKKDAKNAIKDK